jgi:hypothetical protein
MLKSISLKQNTLQHFEGLRNGGKRGTPENEGISLDVYEK